LRQYAQWIHQRPEWPAHALQLAKDLSFPAAVLEAATRDVRRGQSFAALRGRLADELCAEAVSGTRLNNLICDGLLPLIAAATGSDVEGCWHHWFCGDLPPWLTSGLRQLGFFDGRAQPGCHGSAQGLLGWFLAREMRR
jgi:hypothetical protein